MKRNTTTADHGELNQRAGLLLKLLVERYLADGQPVASRTLSEQRGVSLSSATVRNVLADLEQHGFIRAPHTSAGRVPTEEGFRYFIDSLLEVEPLDPQQQQALQQQLREQLQQGGGPADSVSGLLSRLSHLAAMVTVPRQDIGQLRRIEFVPLESNRVLAVLVVNRGQVQNRVLALEEQVSETELEQAADFINRHFAGQTLGQIRRQLKRQVEDSHAQIAAMIRRAADMLSQATAPESDGCVITGSSNLFGFDDVLGVEQLRGLFQAFDRKRDLLQLIERCLQGEGVQIFIGHESGYELLDGCSIVTAPYRIEGETAGVLGVIGPTRMPYDRVIALVEATASALGDALNS